MQPKYIQLLLQQDVTSGKWFVKAESLEGDGFKAKEERDWKLYPYQARDLAEALATSWWDYALTRFVRIDTRKYLAQARQLDVDGTELEVVPVLGLEPPSQRINQ